MNSLIFLSIIAALIPAYVVVDLIRNHKDDRAIWPPVIGAAVLVCGGVILLGWLGFLLGQ